MPANKSLMIAHAVLFGAVRANIIKTCIDTYTLISINQLIEPTMVNNEIGSGERVHVNAADNTLKTNLTFSLLLTLRTPGDISGRFTTIKRAGVLLTVHCDVRRAAAVTECDSAFNSARARPAEHLLTPDQQSQLDAWNGRFSGETTNHAT